MDEQPIELHADTREPIHLSEMNHSEKVDHEYARKGTCCGFMFTEPLGGWRRIAIKTQRCKQDWAQQINELVDVDYPDAERIVLVCDNLNTHNISSLYETFEPAEARRIWERLELHHTPKHGSWLDIAEIELSAFTKGCLDRRISTIEELQRESTAWYMDRNKRQKGVDWQFSVGDARTRHKHLYPTIKSMFRCYKLLAAVSAAVPAFRELSPETFLNERIHPFAKLIACDVLEHFKCKSLLL